MSFPHYAELWILAASRLHTISFLPPRPPTLPQPKLASTSTGWGKVKPSETSRDMRVRMSHVSKRGPRVSCLFKADKGYGNKKGTRGGGLG